MIATRITFPFQVAEPPPHPSAEGEVARRAIASRISWQAGARAQIRRGLARASGTGTASGRVVDADSRVAMADRPAPTHAHAPAEVESKRWRSDTSPHAPNFQARKVLCPQVRTLGPVVPSVPELHHPSLAARIDAEPSNCPVLGVSNASVWFGMLERDRAVAVPLRLIWRG